MKGIAGYYVVLFVSLFASKRFIFFLFSLNSSAARRDTNAFHYQLTNWRIIIFGISTKFNRNSKIEAIDWFCPRKHIASMKLIHPIQINLKLTVASNKWSKFKIIFFFVASRYHKSYQLVVGVKNSILNGINQHRCPVPVINFIFNIKNLRVSLRLHSRLLCCISLISQYFFSLSLLLSVATRLFIRCAIFCRGLRETWTFHTFWMVRLHSILHQTAATNLRKANCRKQPGRINDSAALSSSAYTHALPTHRM